ncbi:MAG: type II secretion system protein [Minisyncoccia bacterium]
MTKGVRGFTLIELLVAIAIVGLLSTVILAYLSSARGKSNDAKVKALLSGVRRAAEIYYDSYSNYGPSSGTGCGMPMFINAPSGMSSYFVPLPPNPGAAFPVGANPTCVATAVGGGAANAYAVSVTLPGLGGTNSWCIDSTGASKGYGGVTIVAGDAVCGP